MSAGAMEGRGRGGRGKGEKGDERGRSYGGRVGEGGRW